MKNEHGKIGWVDLTVKNADQVRDFYKEVIGWKPEAVTMGNYNDWNCTAWGIGYTLDRAHR